MMMISVTMSFFDLLASAAASSLLLLVEAELRLERSLVRLFPNGVPSILISGFRMAIALMMTGSEKREVRWVVIWTPPRRRAKGEL